MYIEVCSINLVIGGTKTGQISKELVSIKQYMHISTVIGHSRLGLLRTSVMKQ